MLQLKVCIFQSFGKPVNASHFRSKTPKMVKHRLQKKVTPDLFNDFFMILCVKKSGFQLCSPNQSSASPGSGGPPPLEPSAECRPSATSGSVWPGCWYRPPEMGRHFSMLRQFVRSLPNFEINNA